MSSITILTLLICIFLSIPAYAESDSPSVLKNNAPYKNKVKSTIKRWYSSDQVEIGNKLYQKHCASCHKSDASGADKWRYKNEKSQYPAPPLNGTAHTWHHSLHDLRRTIQKGGKRKGGTMPGFKNKLNYEQIYAVLAFVQSHWRDEIYIAWEKMNKLSGSR